MKSTWRLAMGLAAVVSLTLLLPAGARATVGSGPIEACTDPVGPYTFTVTITVAPDGMPIASPASNKNATCVDGGDTVAFDVSALPSGATWSATFPSPTAGGLFQDNPDGSACKFGTGQNSSCTVVASPPSGTYSYSVTVKGKTLDPRVIIKGGGKRRHHHRHHKAAASRPTQP